MSKIVAVIVVQGTRSSITRTTNADSLHPCHLPGGIPNSARKKCEIFASR